FYTQHCLRSGWALWEWYYYPLLLTAGPAWLHLIEHALVPGLTQARIFRSSLGTVTFRYCLLGLAGVYTVVHLTAAYIRADPRRSSRYIVAQQLRDFAAEHPGVYAMGDTAGLTTYLMKRPVVQLEGLVADRRMLEFIRRRSDLRDVFAAYLVDYYIGTRMVLEQGCYSAQEPKESEAGPH